MRAASSAFPGADGTCGDRRNSWPHSGVQGRQLAHIAYREGIAADPAESLEAAFEIKPQARARPGANRWSPARSTSPGKFSRLTKTASVAAADLRWSRVANRGRLRLNPKAKPSWSRERRLRRVRGPQKASSVSVRPGYAPGRIPRRRSLGRPTSDQAHDAAARYLRFRRAMRLGRVPAIPPHACISE